MRIDLLVNKLIRAPLHSWYRASTSAGNDYELALDEFRIQLIYSHGSSHFYIRVYSQFGNFINDATISPTDPEALQVLKLHKRLKDFDSTDRAVLKERFNLWLKSEEVGSNYQYEGACK